MIGLNDLKSYKKLKDRSSVLISKIDDLVHVIKDILNGISGCHKYFTMHDIQHSFRVAAYMEQLAFGLEYERIEKFNDLELAVIIFSAILHDIGMFYEKEDSEEIKKNNFSLGKELTYEGVLKVNNGNEEEAIKEIIRLCHAERVKKYVARDEINKCLEINNYSFSNEIIDICKAHGEDKRFVENLSKSYTISNYDINIQYFAEILRIADYLDLDKERTPILWYRLVGPTGNSDSEWRKHFIIQNEKKLQLTYDNKIQIFFNGKSEDAQIHRSFLRYIDDVKNEIEFADRILNTQEQKDQYKLNISTKIDNKVSTIGFTYSDLRLSLNYGAITELLMGKNIYGDSRLGLRELIQNAIDACKLRQEISKNEFEYADYCPQIKIIISKEKNYIKIVDNGIGMSLETITRHFLNIGNSYYTSKEFMFCNYNYKPIGQFGIGFLACFLLSNNVKIKSKKYNDSQVNAIELEKNSEYVVTKIDTNLAFSGTEITLDYASFFNVFETKEKLFTFMEDTFFSEIKITIIDIDLNQEQTIKNSEEKKAVFLNSVKNDKLSIIDLTKFSEALDGFLLIGHKSTSTPKNIDFDKSFIYHEGNFIKAEKDKVDSKTYGLMPFADLNNEELEQLRKEKDAKRFRNAVLAFAKELNKLVYLFFETKSISYIEKEDDDYFSRNLLIDNIHISEHVKKLNYNYYSEIDNWIEPPVFVFQNKYMQLNWSYLDCRFLYPRMKENSNQMVRIYSKDVNVPLGYFSVLLPFIIDFSSALINNNNLELGLDVSRLRIIKGLRLFNWEISLIILNYLINHVPEKSKPFIDKYMNYIKMRISTERT